jgi:hypothetical protein
MIALLDLPDSMNKAVTLARAVLGGTIEPALGCGLIAEVAARLQFPSDLLNLEHLSHLQHGHGALGFTTEGLRPEILKACELLVESHGSGGSRVS